jgi:hypothetical protein
LVCLGIQLGILGLTRIIPSWVGLVHPCGERGRVLQAVTSLSNVVVVVLMRDRQPRRVFYTRTRRARCPLRRVFCCVWKERLSLSVSFLHGPIRSCRERLTTTTPNCALLPTKRSCAVAKLVGIRTVYQAKRVPTLCLAMVRELPTSDTVSRVFRVRRHAGIRVPNSNCKSN